MTKSSENIGLNESASGSLQINICANNVHPKKEKFGGERSLEKNCLYAYKCTLKVKCDLEWI